jgi:predicted nicotinamide N-methyase
MNAYHATLAAPDRRVDIALEAATDREAVERILRSLDRPTEWLARIARVEDDGREVEL